MHKILIILTAALVLGANPCAGHADEPLYTAPRHRLDAAIDANDIAKYPHKADDIIKYSINLLWVNRTLDPGQPYLSSARNEGALVNQFLAPAMKWAVANPQAEVSLWYDSVMATRDAVSATQAILDNHLHHDHITNLRLRDIRDLPIVKKNPDAFSDQTPIYFRVDILKAILILNAVENEHNQAAVFADLEVGDLRRDKLRMNKAELFDAPTMRLLSQAGCLLNGNRNVENQFFQILNDGRTLAAIKYAVINVNLVRAITALNDKEILYIIGLGNAVYRSEHFDLLKYFKATVAGLHLKVRPDIIGRGSSTDAWIDYDPKIHGYAPFGLYYMERGSEVASKDASGEFLLQNQILQFPVETKGVVYWRDVQVRNGRHHVASRSELVHREPAGGGTVYHCELWN